MQATGDRSALSQSLRVCALAMLTVSSGMSCVGVIDECPELGPHACDTGTGGKGGVTGGGGSGGAPVSPAETSERPAGCAGLEVETVDDFESKFIARRCGAAGCHQATLPPKNLDVASMIRASLVGQKSTLVCAGDRYIDQDDPTKSLVLAKIAPLDGAAVACPTPGPTGGKRMPLGKGAMRLTDEEIDCFTWYVKQVAKEPPPEGAQ
jgi:hypothetical protein